jgi:hypothetical protein
MYEIPVSTPRLYAAEAILELAQILFLILYLQISTLQISGTVRPIKKPTKMNKFHIRVGIPSYYLIWLPRRAIFGSLVDLGSFGSILGDV